MTSTARADDPKVVQAVDRIVGHTLVTVEERAVLHKTYAALHRFYPDEMGAHWRAAGLVAALDVLIGGTPASAEYRRFARAAGPVRWHAHARLRGVAMLQDAITLSDNPAIRELGNRPQFR